MANVLVLGAGMISPPLVRYLLSRTEHRVLVGALDTTRVQRVIEEFSRGRALRVDVEDASHLEPLIREAHAIVSLLPATWNPRIAQLALAHRVPLVNTSYVAPGMRALDAAARETGILLLNEIGLDPGIDHMSAVRAARRVQVGGGTVVSFQSCCGGFPAPDANNNPWGYKFSWFPRAVMLAARQPARYLRNGEVVDVSREELFTQVWPFVVETVGAFEIYPNRDSLTYRDAYGLGQARDVFRGTIRYPGWCATLDAAVKLGLLDLDELDWPAGTTYADVATRKLGRGGALIERVASALEMAIDDPVLARFEWAGLLSDRPIPERRAAPLDVFVNRLQKVAQYAEGERDAVVLEHRLVARFPDGHVEDVQESLVAMGERWGDSAMARTVSLPAAIATRLLLKGQIEAVGVHIPVLPEIWRPVLAELAECGVEVRERRIPRHPGPFDHA